MLIMLSGCSGSGKNTIIKGLLDRNKNIKFLRTCTTRAPRPNEASDTYIYLTKEDFKNKISNGEFFEYEEIHTNFYGTLNKSIEDIIKGENHYIKDFGVLGAKAMKESLNGKAKVVSIFLNVPKEELIKRLTERGEKDINLRISRMEFELSHIDNFDYVIDNNNYENTLNVIEDIIKKEEKHL